MTCHETLAPISLMPLTALISTICHGPLGVCVWDNDKVSVSGVGRWP